jgi:hypothetical protein
MDLEVEIKNWANWEDFDRITKYLRNKHNAVLIKNADGPDARFCEFLIDGDVITLIFDDMLGHFFRVPNKESLDKTKLLVKEIEADLR